MKARICPAAHRGITTAIIASSLLWANAAALAQTYQVCVCAPETPGYACSEFVGLFVAVLDPVGAVFPPIFAGQGAESCIDGVAPGSYLIHLNSGRCNPFGCLPREVPVEVVDSGVSVTLPRAECGCGSPYPPMDCTVYQSRIAAACIASALDESERLCNTCDPSGDFQVTVEEIVRYVAAPAADCPAQCR